ncbi:hypothetical protein IFM89_010835 [Coptis chinensis]|uniref:Transmembrane protein n=1 Tax=Coptis chinensis TaxID=261450 RepID=A0A835I2A3_9MAGN|nr:hypothetical protein IFM89_010835 [Coptis chinensis]
MLHSHLFLSPNSLTSFHPCSSCHFPCKPNTLLSFPPQHQTKPCLLLAQLTEQPTTTTADGPVELPPSPTSIFATTDDPTPLQVATSVLLTGAISVFLFRSLRRRAKRAKELKYRSDGVKKSIKEEALDNLKGMKLATEDPSAPPSAAQALLGGIAAGVITLILYKFATTVEAGLNRQVISDNFSVRQITITIRTIINGICYLATFVFGINSVGLILYSGQLALNSFMDGSKSEATSSQDEGKLGTNPVTTGTVDDKESSGSGDDKSDTTQ